LERAVELYDGLGDEKRVAQTLSRLGRGLSGFREARDITRALECFDRAEPILAPLGDTASLGKLYCGRSLACYATLSIEEGLGLAGRAMEVADGLADQALWGEAAGSYGWHLIVNGRTRQGLEIAEKAWRATEDSGHWLFSWTAGLTLGNWLWGLGDPAAAEEWYRRLLDRPYMNEAPLERREVINGLGLCTLARGDAKQARALLPEADALWISLSLDAALAEWDGDSTRLERMGLSALEEARREGSQWNEWGALLACGRAASHAGEVAGARDLVGQAVSVLPPDEAPFFELWSRPQLALLHGEAGDADAARAEVSRCHVVLEKGEDWRGLAGRVLVADAVTLVREGDPHEASDRFRQALTVFDEHQIRSEAVFAHENYGRALCAVGDESGVSLLETAVEAFRQGGAVARAKRLEEGGR
jgi:tetratricopeptide (TPR) repeat protein